MIVSTTNSNEFRSKDGTVVRIPDADFNIVPRNVTKNTTPCSTHCDVPPLGSTSLESHRLSLRSIAKRSRSKDRRADSPRCCKHRRTVRSDTERATDKPLSCLMVHDVVVRIYRAVVPICLSSRALVMGGRRELACPLQYDLQQPIYSIFHSV
ncbi:hypothetical protein TNCV_3761011 [Trichonephila clavipes]|nr:hypothetical protein TNCV_3761011 [Trichonephila clavipes]